MVCVPVLWWDKPFAPHCGQPKYCPSSLRGSRNAPQSPQKKISSIWRSAGAVGKMDCLEVSLQWLIPLENVAKGRIKIAPGRRRRPPLAGAGLIGHPSFSRISQSCGTSHVDPTRFLTFRSCQLRIRPVERSPSRPPLLPRPLQLRKGFAMVLFDRTESCPCLRARHRFTTHRFSQTKT